MMFFCCSLTCFFKKIPPIFFKHLVFSTYETCLFGHNQDVFSLSKKTPRLLTVFILAQSQPAVDPLIPPLARFPIGPIRPGESCLTGLRPIEHWGGGDVNKHVFVVGKFGQVPKLVTAMRRIPLSPAFSPA